MHLVISILTKSWTISETRGLHKTWWSLLSSMIWQSSKMCIMCAVMEANFWPFVQMITLTKYYRLYVESCFLNPKVSEEINVVSVSSNARIEASMFFCERMMAHWDICLFFCKVKDKSLSPVTFMINWKFSIISLRTD